MACACNHSTWEVEEEGSGVQDHSQLNCESEASLDSMRPFLKRRVRRRRRKRWSGGIRENRRGGEEEVITTLYTLKLPRR